MTKAAHMMFGALVADAASLGVHWIYEPKRLAEITETHGDSSAFVPVDEKHYEGVPAYFAHGARQSGQQTQYGEAMWLAMQTMATDGRFDVARQQAAFAGHFGAGGAYRGYIDRPTRGALENIAGEKEITGIDDDQLPALNRLVPLIATGETDQIEAAMQITNVNDVALAYSVTFAGLLSLLLDGVPMGDALRAVAEDADPSIRDDLVAALETDEECSVAYGETTGRACHLPMAGPLIFHILARADDFEGAVERNNKAGGDSAGRSLMIGAAMGIVHGVPLGWALKVQNGDAKWQTALKLAKGR